MPAKKPLEYIIDENGCHVCTSHKRINLNGKAVTVPQYIYRTRVGEVKEGEIVDHKCGNKNCINPEHLTLTTAAKKAAQMAKKYNARSIEYEIDPLTGCYIRTSHQSEYKRFNGKQMTFRQYVYITEVGKEIPEGMIVINTCKNNKCINPKHLTLITKAENAAQKAKEYLAHPLDFAVDPLTGCFNCTSHHTDTSGYPRIRVDKKNCPVHRFVYEQMFGEIPEGLVVRHKCDNTYCCNPEHLELGTPDDNVQDRVKRGRSARLKGSSNGNSKLTEDIVKEIKQRLKTGESVSCLAKAYGVTKTTISAIKLGKLWKHVTID